ncbi:hypothetical protein CSV80_14670 [Sporosarcina sp. P12(2017)]|uniref:hypothetical protein n=1 Tax=unclassified Sporosarcina TaxID=2647733 RepID=UPI000C16A48A|nr:MULTISPECIES: hypothetical protein [unclassified Sporosarcina]PIC56485.1 hypothetical protein CSV81_14535 [Sporosarcina sp. P10]PIC59782.1 hypothetical protein CSV80_14670 [Sporosarcina sp. P12(2017)]PIC76177.1 hypothetical protein CSV74_12985 [Sporosarcina sp. P19]
MSYYYNSYLHVVKREFMFIIMAAVLLVLTFFIWVGVPVFIIGSAVASLTTSQFLVNLCISFSIAIIFSLYFLPINFKVAQDIAVTKKRSTYNSFIRIEIMWIVAIAAILQIILSFILQ